MVRAVPVRGSEWSLNKHDFEHWSWFACVEAALVFSTGMQVKSGTISSLVGKDHAIPEKEAHASIYDGASLSMATERFNYNDMAHLEWVLR